MKKQLLRFKLNRAIKRHTATALNHKGNVVNYDRKFRRDFRTRRIFGMAARCSYCATHLEVR